MAVDIVSTALDFIELYGLIAIFVLLVMDGALMLPVFPGELVLIMAVTTYVDDVPSLLFIILLTTAAGLLGSLLLYGITRGGGRRLVERFPRFFMMPRRRREKMELLFQRPLGQTLVLFLRLLPLTRVLVNIPAGLAKMPIVRFVLLSSIGLVLYHAGFLWFAYEAGREGSAVEAQKNELQASYASPAWEYVQANAIITGAALLLLGAFVAVRAAIRMHKDPEESTGSLIGTLTTFALFWGGVGLAVATYMDPEAVFELMAVGGVDVNELAAALGYGALQVLFATAGVLVLFGFVLGRVRGSARQRKKMYLAWKASLPRRRTDVPVESVEAPLRRRAQDPPDDVEFITRAPPERRDE